MAGLMGKWMMLERSSRRWRNLRNSYFAVMNSVYKIRTRKLMWLLMPLYLLSGCAFYTSLLGYPKSKKPADFTYYDPNFKATNSVKLSGSKIKFSGFYFNHDTVTFEYNAYDGKQLVRKKATTFRYLKFFDDGRIVDISTTNPPDSTIKKTLNRAPRFVTGYFRMQHDTIYIETKNELKGNKSYFHKAFAYENSLRTFISRPKKALISLEYQYRPD
jgi:hypothetical protein